MSCVNLINGISMFNLKYFSQFSVIEYHLYHAII